MILENLADITIGAVYTRIKPNNNTDEYELLDTISMQELNFTIGNITEFEPVESKILASKLESCTLTKEKDVLIGLTMQKAMVVDEKRANKLVLSNFAIIRISNHDILDAYYLCWLINENKDFKRVICQSSQGISYVSTLSLQIVKTLDVPLLNIKTQKIIGHLYKLSIERSKTCAKLEHLKELLLKNEIYNIYKGELQK